MIAVKTIVIGAKTQVRGAKTIVIGVETQVISAKTRVNGPETQVIEAKTIVFRAKTQVLTPLVTGCGSFIDLECFFYSSYKSLAVTFIEKNQNS